jgi:hypothetical protein
MAEAEPHAPLDPVNGTEPLVAQLPDSIEGQIHPAAAPAEEDSAVTKAEKYERHALDDRSHGDEPPSKKVKLEADQSPKAPKPVERIKGIAPIKAE